MVATENGSYGIMYDPQSYGIIYWYNVHSPMKYVQSIGDMLVLSPLLVYNVYSSVV